MPRRLGRSAAVALAFVLGLLPAEAAPRRVVSTFLCTDEYVFRLLPRSQIGALSFEVGLRHPVVATIADQVAGIAQVHNSAEEVLSHHPDLVVMFAGTQARLHAQLRNAGVRILDVPWANSLADIRAATLSLGRSLGAEARARALVEAMNAKLDAARRAGAPVRTLIYQPNGYAASGPVTDEVLAAANLNDVAREYHAARTGAIPLERVIASPPELLIFDQSDAKASLAELMLEHPALKAAENQMVVGHVGLTPFLCPGPWSVANVRVLADWGDKARALAQARAWP